MDSKMQTSLLLILGTIALFGGYLLLYPADPSELARQQVLALIADPTTAKVAIVVGYGGALAMIIGLWTVSRTMFMAGGAGAPYANIAFVLLIAATAGMAMRACMALSITGASTMSSGLLLFNIEEALAVGTPLVLGPALILLGLGIYFAKNFHIGVAAIVVVAGLISTVRPFLGIDVLELVGLVGFGIASLAIGISRFRAAN